MSNIITVTLTAGKMVKTSPLFQWDYGQIMRFQGAALPASFEVHFANVPDVGAATVQVGSNSQVEIPNEYLITGLPVYAWIFLSEGDADGETVYAIKTPVIRRPMPADITIPSAQRTAVQQAIAALNAAADRFVGPFGKSTVNYHGVTIEREGNTITMNGQGNVAKQYLYLDLSGGGLAIADDGLETPGLLQLHAGHTYSMTGEFTGSITSDPEEPVGECVQLRLTGAGLNCNEYEDQVSTVLNEDVKGSLLLRVIIGARGYDTDHDIYSYPIYTNYKVVFNLDDTLIIE